MVPDRGTDVSWRTSADELSRAPGFDATSQLVQDAPVAIYAVDLDGVVLSWNRAAEQLFGWTADEATGHRLPFLPDDKIAEVLTTRDQLVAGHPIEAMEYRPVTRDDSDRHVMTSASLLRDDEGRPTAVIGFALDVTAKHEAAATVARAEAKWRLSVTEHVRHGHAGRRPGPRASDHG